MSLFSYVETTARELLQYRIAFLLSSVLIIFTGLIYSALPGAQEPMVDRYIVAALAISSFFAVMVSNWAKRNAYYFIYAWILYFTAEVVFITTLNGSRIEYIAGLIIAYLFFIMQIKSTTHLLLYNLYLIGLYIVLAVGATLSDNPQNIQSAVFLFIVIIGSFVLARNKIDKDKLISKEVQLRTAELQTEQLKLRAAISAYTGLLVIVDPDGKVILSNNKFEEVLGVRYEPASIQEIQQVFGGSYDISGAYRVALQQLKVIDHSSVEFQDKYLRVLFAPVYTPSEARNIIGVLMLIGDVTEEELLDRARDEFFAIASHELRTPLTAIQGNLALVLDYMHSDKMDEKMLTDMLQDAMTSSQRLIRLVHDFLDLSRLEQGRVKFEEQQVDLALLVNQVLTEYAQEMSSKGLTYAFDNQATQTVIHADEDRVKQVIVNLISNAVKYTEKGQVMITLRPKDQTQLEVLITDTGIGISEENQKYLFRKFQQAGHNVLTRDTSQGTGLGLYISRLIIRALGGDVYLISSEPGKGTTFGFFLPVKK